MTDQQLDELFKNRLTDHRSSVPGDMWERILRKKKDDRKGFLFFFKLFGLFVLGFVFAGFLFISINRKKEISVKQPVPSLHAGYSVNGKNIDSNLSRPLNPALTIQSQSRSTTPSRDTGGAQTKTAFHFKSKNTYQTETALLSKTSESAGSGRLSEEHSTAADSAISETKDSITKKSETPDRSFTKDDTADIAKTNKSDRKDSANKRNWFLDVYASPDYPIITDYPMKLSYSIGFRLNRQIGRHFSVKTGIQFSQINYKLTDTIQLTNTEHLKSWDVPVLTGYTFGNSHSKMTVNTGFIFNLYSWYDNPLFGDTKLHTGLSLYLGLNFEKQIHPRFYVFGEPYYRYRLKPMTIDGISTKQFIDIAGLSIGLRYYFK